jgi:hypothetical protein
MGTVFCVAVVISVTARDHTNLVLLLKSPDEGMLHVGSLGFRICQSSDILNRTMFWKRGLFLSPDETQVDPLVPVIVMTSF